MKTRILSPILAITVLMTGCISVPTSVNYNGTEIPAVSPSSDCNKPYALDQDCSGMSGAKRKIEFENNIVRIAGSADGTTIFVMSNKKFGFDTMRLTITSSAIEAFLVEKGFNVIETQAMAVNGEIAGYYFVFDGDIYSIMKEFSIED